MARGRRPPPREAFWISYSDLTTGLLLIFIVLVAAMIAHYRNKQEAILGAVDNLLLVQDQLAQRLKSAADETNVVLGHAPDDIAAFKFDKVRNEVLIEEGAWFDQGRWTLKPEAERTIEAFFPLLYDAMLARDIAPGEIDPMDYLAAIEIQGHTDPSWAGTEPWSWDSYYQNNLLSQRRASAVAAYMGGLLDAAEPSEARRWRPFFAYVQTTGRSWTAAYCRGRVLGPADFAREDPCPGPRDARDDPRSRRVTFGIRIDDQAVVARIEREVDAQRAEQRRASRER